MLSPIYLHTFASGFVILLFCYFYEVLSISGFIPSMFHRSSKFKHSSASNSLVELLKEDLGFFFSEGPHDLCDSVRRSKWITISRLSFSYLCN